MTRLLVFLLAALALVYPTQQAGGQEARPEKVGGAVPAAPSADFWEVGM